MNLSHPPSLRTPPRSIPPNLPGRPGEDVLAYLEVQRLKEELRSGVTQEQKRAAVTIQAGYRGFMTRKLCAKLKEIKAMFATLQAASDKVRTEGWVFKKGGQKGHRRNWNERYFKLSGGGLAYFADREMTQQKGWIDLATLDGTELVKRSSQHFTTPEMKQRHMKMTTITYSDDIRAWEKGQQWPTTLRLMQEI